MLKKISVFFAAFLFFTNAFSQQNVISINYIDELVKIGEDENFPVSGNYSLLRDLDFNDPNSYQNPDLLATYTTGVGWLGIPSFNKAYFENIYFSGTFNGNNHIIKNLFISATTGYNVYSRGLFSAGSNCTIKNLGVINVNIANVAEAGGLLAGIIGNAVIDNCYVTGKIFAAKSNGYFYLGNSVGGLVGVISLNAGTTKCTISNCYTNLQMGGYTLLGSLVGYLNSSSGTGNVSIKNCYTTGNIEVINARNYGLLIGTLYTSVNGTVMDSIINCYSTVKPIKTTPIGITRVAAKIIGEIINFNNNSNLSIKIKGCFGLYNDIPIVNYNPGQTNTSFSISDTVFAGSLSRNFSPLTSATYSSTYLYNAANQQYPLLKNTDSILLGGQRAVYPSSIEKNSGSINGFAGTVTPIDNFTKNGSTQYGIENINGVMGNNPYISINSSTGTLSWIESIPSGNYLVEIVASNGSETNTSWVQLNINKPKNVLTNVNAQSIQFTASDTNFANSDFIGIDSLNLINRNYTIETWAKLEGPIRRWARIFDFGTGANSNGILLGFPTNTQLGYHANGGDKIISFPAGFNPRAWNHYAITLQDTLLKLYINGELVDSYRGNKASLGYNKNYLGKSNYAAFGDSSTTGRYSECRIWLQAKTGTEIKAFYNKQVPTNSDSLYVYLPLTSNIYGSYSLNSNGLLNSITNYGGFVITPYFHRKSNFSMNFIYDSSQQYVYGSLNSALANDEILQIAVKDSNNWNDVTNISNYFFSYKLPESFISGNIYVRSIINGVPTNRFGNTYNESKYYVDWVGTNLRLNPNITFKTFYPGGNSILFQRNKTNTPYTIINPIIAKTTDATQTYRPYIYDPFYYFYQTPNPLSRKLANHYSIGLVTVYSYTPQADTFIAKIYGTPLFAPARNKDISIVNTNGNNIITIDNKAPMGVYNFAFHLVNSLNAPSLYINENGEARDVQVIQAILADSLKAVNYTKNNYINTAFKAVKTGIPQIVGNDSVVQALRYQILVRRNGIDVTNLYTFNESNFEVSTINRPIGVDSVFLTFVGWFNEVVTDTLLFSFVYTKPSIKYSPNVSNDFSLVNGTANFFPIVLDSGGKALTYSFTTPNGYFTINNQTGRLSLTNWDNLTVGSPITLSIEANNGTYRDTTTFTYTKNALNRVIYYSNSSYRTYSTNGEDYVQLPSIDLRNKAFGMDIWYKHNDQTGNNHRIIDIGTGGNNQGVLLMFPDTTHIFVRTPSQSDYPISIPAGVNIRNWNHYLISVSSTGVASFFINGKLIFSRAGGGTTPQVIFNSNFIGKSNYGGGDAPSVGQFTDFRIWDNAIDSTIYNIRGINNFTTGTGANLIYYLPLSLPLNNSNLPLPNNYTLINKAGIFSTAILDSIAYIKGSSNSYNFDQNRIFIAGQSAVSTVSKTITVTTNNYASVADTNTKIATATNATYNNRYYWNTILPSSQGAYLNNQIIGVKDSSSSANINYNYLITYIPNYTTYIPGDSLQVFTSKAGFIFPRNDFWVASQKPTKYTLVDSGGLHNVINFQLDTVTGKFSWLSTYPIDAVYPIKINVTNDAGTIGINCKVLLSDSLRSIKYTLDSISVNYGNDSNDIPFTEGITPTTIFTLTSIPSKGVQINPLNGRIYWTTKVPAGLYTLKVQASNYINMVTKTIKLNIKLLAPTGLSYQSKTYSILNTGFDTATTYIPAPVINTGGAILFTANIPAGCRIDSNTGAIICKNNLVAAGNYTVFVNAQNAVGFVKDTININVITTSKDSIIGYKNAYYSLNTNATNINGDYISLPSITLPANFSIEAWVKLNDITRNYQQIFEAGNAANSHIVSIGTFGTSGRLFITIPTAATGNSSNDIPDPQVAPRIANNTWFHIVYVKRGTNVKLYLNGTQIIETNTAISSYNDPITRVYFGATNFPNNSMLGQLDECRIWKKALSEDEINRYKTVFLTPQEDSLYVYLPLNGVLAMDTNIATGTIIKNSATGASALTGNITSVGSGMKMSRDPNRQIVYGTHDSTTTLTKLINVKTHFYNLPISSDSTTTAVKYGSYWATENKKIPANFILGTLEVSKGNNDYYMSPNPFYVYFPPSNITYNNLNTFKLLQSASTYITNKPIVYTNYDSTNLRYSITSSYTGVNIDTFTGIISINADTVLKLYGNQIKPIVIAKTGLGKTSTVVTFNIKSTSIIGYNNTSVCLPNSNGADYIRIPSLDLSNANFSIDVWFKLIGSPINNKRIFDFAPGTTGSARSGLIMYFPANQLKFGAFAQDGLINLGNADTVLKNGLNEWNKFSVFYNASTKTYYVYINGVFKQMATVATDMFTSPLISNFLANNNYADPITDGYFREFKIYKNLSYTDFINNLPYNILPNRIDNSLYYYLPLSNNNNNVSYIGNVTINNNTELTNRALLYNSNALNTNAVLTSANNRAFYYGDSVNQIVTGEFADQVSRFRYNYTNGVIKDTILPNIAAENYSWRIRGKNISGKFKVYNSVSPQYADSINILIAPSKLNYASNNRGYPLLGGNSGTPTIIGTDTIQYSIDSGNVNGFVINPTTGVINWNNSIPAGLYKLRVLAVNQVGSINFTYIVNLQDTLKGFSYSPDSIQASGNNADSLPFLPSFTKGTGAVFSLLNYVTGFSINATNGKIYWTNTVSNGVYKLRVQANNIYNLPLVDTITIKLTSQAPSNLQYLKDTMGFIQGVHLQTPKPSINKGGLRTIYAINNITPSGGIFSIDTITGEVKWSNTTVGSYSITMSATNNLGVISKTIYITISSSANIAILYNNASFTLGVQKGLGTFPNRVVLPSLDLRGEGYTIETWAKAISPTGVGNWRRIFDFGTGQNYDGIVLGFQSETKLGVHASSSVDNLYNFPVNFNALNWNHYAVSVTDSVRLYVNGALIGTGVANTPNVIFNKNYINFSNWLNDDAGLNAYQEFRVWKYARNRDEIANNYHGSVPNDAFGLYYYLPFKKANYSPGLIINPINFVIAPEEGLNGYGTYYKSYITNAAVKSNITDSSKLLAVISNLTAPNIVYQMGDSIPYFKIDSTRQIIQGYYAGTLLAGEVLQYSIDTGKAWKNINFVNGNIWSQIIDTGFKFGLIKIRGAINNVATNRVINDINVVVYPNPPTNVRATAIDGGSANVQFIPPVVNAGITGYKIYTSTGELVGTTTQSPALISGLNNEQIYRFQVSAINPNFESFVSTLSNLVTAINTTLQITTFTNNILGVNITPTSTITQYSNFRVTYQVNTGYKIDSILIDNVKNIDSLAGYTFLNINFSHSVKIFVSKIKFTISISKNEGGVVNSNQSIISVNYGDTSTIQFIPNNRYKIDSVFINEVYQNSSASSYTFNNIQQNYTVRVVFKAIVYYTILVESVGNGNVYPTGLVEVESGTNYSISYIPTTGYKIDSIIVNNVLVNDSTKRYTFTNIQNNGKIRVVFKIKTFSITSIVKNGSITPSGTNTYNYGTQVRYNYAPINNGYVLDSLLIDGVLQINPDTASYTFNSLDTNHIIQIVFNLKAAIKYAIQISKTEGVTVTPSTDQQVSYGGNLRVTWVGNTGFILDSIFVNGVYNRDSINGYTFTNVRGVQSIYIKYKIQTFTITSTVGLHGTISPFGISVVNYGTNKSFILLPDIGYETDSLFINGTSVTKPLDNIYTFSNVTANQTIFVTFKVNLNPCSGTKSTPNIVRVGDALKSDITTFAKQRWYLAGTIKDSTLNNTYTPTDAGVYTLLGVDGLGCESNISKKYYYAKTCITPAGRLGNGAYIQASVIDNSSLILVKWCTELVQDNITIKILNLEGENIYEQKLPANLGVYIINKAQIKAKNYVIEVIDSKGEVLQISDVVN